MANCTFFGHRDCPESIKPKLREVLVDLITNHDVDMFYVGHQGRFDAYVHSTLKALKQEYSQINYAVGLAYMPGKKTEYDDYSDTMLPEGIESIHPHYAISWCNNWMLKQSDYVVTYTTRTWGGAAQYALKARKWNKIIMEITLDKLGERIILRTQIPKMLIQMITSLMISMLITTFRESMQNEKSIA